MSWLLFALAALPQNQGSHFAKPGWAWFAIPHAVDHVAVMAIAPRAGQTAPDPMTLTRSGPWLREETIVDGQPRTTVSNVALGTSYHYWQGAGGRFEGLTITGRHGTTPQTIRKTRQTGRLLGETCTVWQFSTDYSTELNCLTSDGILLWQRVKSGDSEVETAHAVSIVRRHISAARVRPPAGLLDIATWGGWAPLANPAGDAVWLTAGPRFPDIVILRRLGAYSLRDQIDGRGRHRIFQGDGIAINMVERPDGGLYRLDLVRTPARPEAMFPVVPDERKTIFGQPCTMVRSSLDISDYGRFQCRTAGGLVLEETTNTRASGMTLTATRIDRTQTLADLAPPPNLLRTVR